MPYAPEPEFTCPRCGAREYNGWSFAHHLEACGLVTRATRDLRLMGTRFLCPCGVVGTKQEMAVHLERVGGQYMDVHLAAGIIARSARAGRT